MRLWQDHNQDGISQGNELATLQDKGIVSIRVSGAASGTNLDNGNTVGATAAVTHSDGRISSAGAFDLNLVHSGFHRSFSHNVGLSDAAVALPDMGGAGWVRDLREAMSLGTAQAQALTEQVQAFAAGTTRAEQMAGLDALIRAWADSNEYRALKPLDDPLRRFVVTGNGALSARLQAVIPVMEIFNGLVVEQAGMQAPQLTPITLVGGGTATAATYLVSEVQATAFLNAYEVLRQSVYGALVMQTRLKPYLDAVELVIDDQGVSFSLAGLDSMVNARLQADPFNAVADVLDLRLHAKNVLAPMGWQAEASLAAALSAHPLTPELTAMLQAERLYWAGGDAVNIGLPNAQAGFTVLGNHNDNVMSANAGGTEVVYGLAGNDTLYSVGNGDTLDGGEGNRGDGADVITDNRGTNYIPATTNTTDTLWFGEGIDAEDLWFRRMGNHLVMDVLGDGGQVQINNWFNGPQHRIEDIRLSEGERLAIVQLDLLIQAMASFAPPAPGQTSFTSDQQTALAPLITVAWVS